MNARTKNNKIESMEYALESIEVGMAFLEFEGYSSKNDMYRHLEKAAFMLDCDIQNMKTNVYPFITMNKGGRDGS